MRLNFDKGRLFFRFSLFCAFFLSFAKGNIQFIYLFFSLTLARTCFKPLSFSHHRISTTKFVSCCKRWSFRGSAKFIFRVLYFCFHKCFVFPASTSPLTQLWPRLDRLFALFSCRRPPDVTRTSKEEKHFRHFYSFEYPSSHRRVFAYEWASLSRVICLTFCLGELMHNGWVREWFALERQRGNHFSTVGV